MPDDIVLIASSAIAVRKLLGLCKSCACDYSISFNAGKTKQGFLPFKNGGEIPHQSTREETFPASEGPVHPPFPVGWLTGKKLNLE
jgi:hypothetical protein